MSPSLDDLMCAYAVGDEAAFETLYRALAPRLLAFYRRSGLSPELSGELVQQTFLRLHLARGRYRVGEPVVPWVYRIATNLLIDLRRRKRTTSERLFEEGEEVNVASPQPEEGVPQELSERLQRALEALPDAQREVIVLHKYAGLSMQDVAVTLGVSVSAVKVRAFRGYQVLRKVLVAGGES